MMARGRMIDKRIGNSKKIGKISDKAARLYFMLYPHLDKKGRIAFDDLDDLKIEIIPCVKNWSLKKIGEALNELADIELIHLYPDDNKIAMEFDRFEDFQTIRDDREADSKISPPRETPGNSGVFRITPALRLSLRLSLSLMKSNEGIKKEVCFDLKERKFQNITNDDIEGWRDAYPNCNIEGELKKMREWLLANPDKQKKNYRRFIVNWFIRTRDNKPIGNASSLASPERSKALSQLGTNV